MGETKRANGPDFIVADHHAYRLFERVWDGALAKRAGITPAAVERMRARGWTFADCKSSDD